MAIDQFFFLGNQVLVVLSDPNRIKIVTTYLPPTPFLEKEKKTAVAMR